MKTCVPSLRGKRILLVTALWLALVPRVFSSDLLVYNNNDSGAGSLRQAIVSNNATAGGNTILFSNVVTGTIMLTGGELFINKNLTILGPGAKVLAVNGNDASRVLHFTNCVATVSGLTIANGYTTGSGGGIANNSSTLTISHCLVTGNSANNGGGIYNLATSGRSLALIASTVSRNSATSDGGGIESSGTMTVTNSTIFGNSANVGGGIRSSGTAILTVTASTIASNSAATGGGIRLQGSGGNNAQLRIGGTILKTGSGANISKNSAADVISDGYNLSSDNSITFLDQTTDLNSTDPLLGPLQDNGGPTPTMALKVGSPAIDKSKSFALTTDQRGQPRIHDNPNIAHPTGGDGADIGAYEASQLRIVSAQKTGAHLRLDFLSWFGANYEVQSRSDLATGNWASLPGSTPGNGGIVSVTVSNAFGLPRQFYRIHSVPCSPGTPGCPWQQGDMHTASQSAWGDFSTTVGSLLGANFSTMYGGSGLVVGGPNTMTFTSSSDVFAYLPASGSPGVLTFDVQDPITTPAGELGGQVVALKLNVDFSATFGNSVALGDLRFCNFSAVPSLNGQTVGEFLTTANSLLGGGGAAIGPATAASVASLINSAFVDGTPSSWAQAILVNGPCP